ncbi:MAG: NAD+ synthase [Thermodesulfovibrionia bacterium]
MNIRVALSQINPTVGDLSGNTKKIISYIKMARAKDAHIVAFPELAITGYPPEDLLLKPQFIDDNLDALNRIIGVSNDIIIIVGFVDRKDGLFNSAAIISNKRLVDVYHKRLLPNYGVFDEYRYFKPGKRFPVYSINGCRFGVNICEDIWHEQGPAKIQALNGAGLIININASPYHMGKISFREEVIRERVKECRIPIVYVNMVGGQDEIVFDGGSFVLDGRGDVIARAGQFREEIIYVDVEVKKVRVTPRNKREIEEILCEGESVDNVTIPLIHRKIHHPIKRRMARVMPKMEEVYHALLLGTRDYIRKNCFNGVVIGMSGGIDSSLVATIAVDAIGRENVHGIFMPSRYTSAESYEDVNAHANNIGINLITIPIDDIFNAYLNTLSKPFEGTGEGVTEENIQARIRGNILMAFSNKFGWLVLTTGNKSEMSVGYATLYGDMAGGFAVIKDVPKTMVYELCKWRNEKEGRELIPSRILWKEPTAELRPDQRDTDTLPPYPVLDPILKAYVEEDKSFKEILEMGCDVACAQKVIGMVDRSEYKRRQSPPGIKITPRAFGKDRRFPITNRYRSY